MRGRKPNDADHRAAVERPSRLSRAERARLVARERAAAARMEALLARATERRLPPPPAHVTRGAAEVWLEEIGHLTALVVYHESALAQFATYCEAEARRRDAALRIEADGLYVKTPTGFDRVHPAHKVLVDAERMTSNLRESLGLTSRALIRDTARAFDPRQPSLPGLGTADAMPAQAAAPADAPADGPIGYLRKPH